MPGLAMFFRDGRAIDIAADHVILAISSDLSDREIREVRGREIGSFIRDVSLRI